MNMDFMEDGSDKDFFAALKSSNNKLDELFGIGESAGGKLQTQNNENHTLKYQPPKPHSKSPYSSSSSWTTVIVKFVYAYKNGEHIGKLGMVLLTMGSTLKILAYKKKTDILAALTLKPEELASPADGRIFQQDAYTQFYDDSNVFWSFRFDSPNDEAEFMRALQNAGVQVQKSSGVEVKAVETTLIKDTQPTENIPKRSLVSRMGKIGGYQLPAAVVAAPAQPHDNSDDSTEMVVTRQDSPTQQLVPLNPVYAVSHQPVESPFVQMVLTENRVHNSELRMNMSKLDSKMESLLDRFESVRLRASSDTSHDDEVLALEEKILELKKENRKLKQSLESGRSQRPNNSDHQLEKTIVSMKDDLSSLKLALNKDYEGIFRDLVRMSLTMRNDLEAASAEKSRLENAHEAERLETEKLEMRLTSQLEAMRIALKAKEVELLEYQENQKNNPLESRLLEDYKRRAESSMKFAMMDLYSNLMMQFTEIEPATGHEKLISQLGRTMKQEIQKTYEDLRKQLASETDDSHKN